MFTLADVFLALGRPAPAGSETVAVAGVQLDSRLDVAGRLFVAIRTDTAGWLSWGTCPGGATPSVAVAAACPGCQSQSIHSPVRRGPRRLPRQAGP